MEYINQTNLRNELQIFKFNPEAASFGKGGAQIYDVRLLDEQWQPLAWVVGGEKVTLCVKAKAHQTLDSPIIGFYVKDRLGQFLFGDNTFITYQNKRVSCEVNTGIQAEFTFYMPILPVGDYSVMIAIANGTQDEHEQHHWIHEAVFFKSETSSVVSGLIGVPMKDIKLHVLKDDIMEIFN